MSISLRFFLFTDAGMQRVSQRVMDGLCHGEDAMPQFAETKQKIVGALVEFDDGKPLRILDVSGSYLEFDKHGKVLEGYLAQGAFEAMETYDALERSKRVLHSIPRQHIIFSINRRTVKQRRRNIKRSSILGVGACRRMQRSLRLSQVDHPLRAF